MQYHDGNSHLGMGWPPISWTHFFSDPITIGLAYVTHHWQKFKVLLRNKRNANKMRVGDTILAGVAEVGIDKNWFLLDNKLEWNAFIKCKYLSNIRDDPDVKYLHVHCNTGVTYTDKIGDLPGYSNTVCYNPKGIAKTLSLGLVQKHHLVTYNSQYGNGFVVHIPQQPTFKITKASLFYHNMRHFIKNNNNLHIMVNYSCSPIPQVEGKKKQ